MKKLSISLSLVAYAIFAAAQINLTDSLMAHLPLNSNGNDLSGNNNHATVSVNGVYGTLDRLSVANNAMLFNGAIENGMLDFGTPLLNGKTEFSMSFWFNPASLNNGMSLVGQDNILETGFYTSATRIVVWHPLSTSVNVNLSQGEGVWQHLAVTTSATQMNIYLNGALVNTLNGNYTLGVNATNTRIGGNVVNTSNNSWFRGSIDEVRFYNRVLTQDEINFLSSSLSLTYSIGNLSSTDFCAGASFNIPFTVIGANIQSTNVFTAQLSDANGDFSNATSIGTLQSTTSGTISATLLANIPNGTGYKLRIVSSEPQAIGTTSSATLTIQNPRDGFSTLSRDRMEWLKFDANTADSSGSGNHATAVGGTSYISDRFGNSVNAIQLNGTNGHVTLPAGVWFNGAFAVSAWINPTTYANWSRVIDFANGAPGDNVVFAITNGTSGNLDGDIRIGTGSANAIASTSKPSLNAWSHVLLQYDGTNAKIYLNGALAGSAAISAPRLVSRINNYIGRSAFGTDAYANCAFDDFMIFSRALTEDEIQTLANDGIIFANNTPCAGNFLQLSAPAIPNAAYSWSGPNGFSSNQRQNVIPNVTTANSGNYSLTITQSGCAAFSQTKNITINNASNQVIVSFSGLPAVTNLDAAENTLTGTPSGGYFTGNGMEVNVFNPFVAGLGTHIILYNVPHSSGCLTTIADTVIVYDSYNMQNGTVTACNGGFYDSGGRNASYSVNENFTQTFCSDNGEKLKFTFSWLSLGTGDTLWAYDGNTTSANLLGMYIPFSTPDVIWSSGTCITFRFKSNASAQTSGWIATFECSQNPEVAKTISLNAGINVTCDAVIRDPAGTGNYGYGNNTQTLKSRNGERLRLDFFEFNINFNNGGHWLNIYDGPNAAYPRIGSYNSCCAPPTIIESAGEYLTLVFDANNTSAGVGSRQGFGATVSCFGIPLTEYWMNDTLVTTCSGVFYDNGGPSADFIPNTYQKQTFCSDNGKRIKFNFNNNLSLFDSDDTLWVYDGGDTTDILLAYYIEGSNIEPLTAAGTCLTFRYKSNASTEHGWQGFITCSATPGAQDIINLSSGLRATCNAIVRDPAGTGNYGYGHNTQTLRSYYGSRLRLDFFQFNINFNNGGHWLNIYDGPSTAYPRIGSYNSCCAPPTIIESSGEYLTLVFDANNTSAGVGAREGFAATVSCFGSVLPVFTMHDTLISVCEGVFYDDNGPANNFSPNQNKTQTFCSANGQLLQFAFNNNESSFDSGDTLWVFDGADVSASPLAMYIEGSRIETLTSTGTCLTFKFVSNASTEPGWQGFLSCVNAPPAQVTYVMSSGTRNICTGKFLDPGSTGNYSVGSGETYIQTFTSYSGQQVRATRNSFSINGNNGGHWLDVYDGTSTAAPLIGSYNNFNFPPAAFQSTGSSLTFRFRATNTSAGSGSGFDFTISCFTGSPIDADWLSSPVCQNGAISVPFVLNDSVNANNVYTAQLSDSLGNFNNAVNIGTLASTDSVGTISATIPLNTPAGSGYRIRVNSSQPVQLGSASPNSILILRTPTQPGSISVNGSTNFCSGTGSAILSITNQTGINYRWILNDTITVGTNSNSFTATQSGVYKVDLSSACDTIISTASVTINSITSPVATTIAAGGPTSFCSSGSVQLSIPAQTGMNYQWKRGATNVGTNTNTSTASVAGDYTVVVSNTCGSVTSSNTISVSITGSSPTAPTISPNGATTFCSGGNVTLSIPTQAGATYQWKQGSANVGTNSESYTATQAGTYTVVVTNGCGSATSANSITVTVNFAPVAPTIATNGATTFCSGGSVELSVSVQSGMNYQWKNGANDVGTNSNTYTATQAGTYTVELSNSCGNATSSNSITVAISGSAPAAPTITANGATTFCSGNSVELSIPTQSGVTYQWKNGSNSVGTNSNTYTATQAGTYTVELTNNCGTTVSSNSITVTISGSAPTVPSITASGPTAICTGGSIELSVSSQTGGTYQWKEGANNVGTNSNTYTATQAGTYTIELTNSCGSATSSNSITVTITGGAPSAPTITANGATTFCAGNDVELSVPMETGATYQWKQGANNVGTNSNVFTATQAGAYTVVVSNGCGSANSVNSITVTISGSAPAIPTITANGPTAICTGGNVQLNISAQSGVTYQWKEGTTPIGANSNTFTATQAGIYTIELTNNCGTVASSNSITVTVTSGALATPTISANGATTICAGNSVELSVPAQSGADYQWKNGANNIGTNSNTFTVTQSGTYTIELSNGCGSVNSTNNITVVVNATSSAQISETICAGASYPFNGQTLTTSGQYNQTLANAVGCDSVITLTLTVRNPITSTLTVSNHCGTYDFNGQTLSQSGAYNTTRTSASGCDSVVTVNFTYNAAPALIITQNFMTLETSFGFADYQWYLNGVEIFGAIGPVHIPLQPGVYTVEVTGFNGCTGVSANFNFNTVNVRADIADTEIEIFPNPASSVVSIQTNFTGLLKVEVIATDGRKLFSAYFAREKQIDISEWAAGLYVFRLQNESGISKSLKVVKP